MSLVSQGLDLAQKNSQLCELLGEPLTTGPWYNASLAFSHKAHIANCKFRVDGTKCSSDVIVRVSSCNIPTILLSVLPRSFNFPLGGDDLGFLDQKENIIQRGGSK